MGSPGKLGHKGEPENADDQEINLLQDQVNLLSLQVEVLKNQSTEN